MMFGVDTFFIGWFAFFICIFPPFYYQKSVNLNYLNILEYTHELYKKYIN